jgi:hypothetical protein
MVGGTNRITVIGWAARPLCRSSASFGSSPTGRLDRRGPVLCEVFEALDHFVTEAAYECQSGIAERGEHFRRVTGMSPRLILAATDIAHVMKTVFDAPVRACQSQQLVSPARAAVRLVMA